MFGLRLSISIGRHIGFCHSHGNIQSVAFLVGDVLISAHCIQGRFQPASNRQQNLSDVLPSKITMS